MSRNPVQKLADDWAGTPPLGEEAPWVKFDYLKLRETLEAIISGMEATQEAVEPMAESEPDGILRLVVANENPNTPATAGPEELSA
jgi:hypothetical protein